MSVNKYKKRKAGIGKKSSIFVSQKLKTKLIKGEMGERQMMGQANDEQLDISGKHKGKKHRKRGEKNPCVIKTTNKTRNR